MSARLHPDRGWWIKFDRAQEHLDELDSALKPFCQAREHPVTGKIESKKRPREWVYRVHFAGELDQSWDLIIGDFLFDLSCALDHLAVALNPLERKDKLIYFPIYWNDPWRRVEGTRRYFERDPGVRKDFTDSTRHMLPEARAHIKRTQPYVHALETGSNAEDEVLAVLKRFHTTDKHRRLFVITQGSRRGLVQYKTKFGIPQEEIVVAPGPDRLIKNNAPVKRLNYQVGMKFVGPLEVAFARREPRPTKTGFGPFLAASDLPLISKGVEERLRTLEPYIQW